MIPVALFSLLCLGVGLPVAVLLARRERPQWAAVVAEGLFLGLAWYLVAGLVLARLGLLGRLAILVPTVAAAGFGWYRALPVLARWPRPQPTWLAGGLVTVVAAGAFLRRDAFYFMFQTADFGEYVNRANILAAGGPFHDWFLHLFSVALGLSNVALGPAGTVDIVPFFGLLVVVGIAALGQRLGFAPVVVVGVLVALVVEPVAVWFSRFPASETLYAALLVAFVHFFVLAIRRGGRADVAVPAMFAGLMMVTRANAVLVAPVLVVVLGVCSVVLTRPMLRRSAVVVVASILALFGGFIYNARNSAAYFVDYQLEAFTPGRLFSLIDTLDRPLEAAAALVVLSAALVALVVLALGVNRLVGPSSTWAPTRWARVAVLPGLALTMALAVPVAFRPLGLIDALPRYGWFFLALVALGVPGVLVAVSRRSEDPGRVVAAVLAVVVGGAFVLLFARRLPEAHDAPYHLYWDRYLFSEVFPAMALVGLWGGAALVGGFRWLARRRAGVPMAAVLGTVILVAAGFQVGQRLGLQREGVLFDQAYGQFQALDQLVGPAGVPVIYAGLASEDLPEGWLHTNTYRVFALPLQQSFGRAVLNIDGVEPFAPDPRPSDAEVAAMLRRSGAGEAVLVAASGGTGDGGGGMATQSAPALRRQRLGSLTMEIPLLPRRLDPAEEAWRDLTMDLDVWRVFLPAGRSRAPGG